MAAHTMVHPPTQLLAVRCSLIAGPEEYNDDVDDGDVKRPPVTLLDILPMLTGQAIVLDGKIGVVGGDALRFKDDKLLFHEVKIGQLSLLNHLTPGTASPLKMKVFLSLVNQKALQRNMDGCYVAKCKLNGKAGKPILCDSCPRGCHLICAGRSAADGKADLFHCNLCQQDAQEMHNSVMAEAGSSLITITLPKAITEVIGLNADVDHLFLVTLKPGSAPQPLFFRNGSVKQGLLTLHLPSATSTALSAELLAALSASKGVSGKPGSSSVKPSVGKPSSVSDLVSRVADGILLVDPTSWRAVQVENVWCTACDMSVPQMPLRTHLPMTEMQASKPTDILHLPHNWIQRHYPELFQPPTSPAKHPIAPSERMLNVVVHGVGPALQHLVTNVKLLSQAGSDALLIDDARVKVAILRCMVPAQSSVWMTSLLCSGPGVLDVEVVCMAAKVPGLKQDSTAEVVKLLRSQPATSDPGFGRPLKRKARALASEDHDSLTPLETNGAEVSSAQCSFDRGHSVSATTVAVNVTATEAPGPPVEPLRSSEPVSKRGRTETGSHSLATTGGDPEPGDKKVVQAQFPFGETASQPEGTPPVACAIVHGATAHVEPVANGNILSSPNTVTANISILNASAVGSKKADNVLGESALPASGTSLPAAGTATPLVQKGKKPARKSLTQKAIQEFAVSVPATLSAAELTSAEPGTEAPQDMLIAHSKAPSSLQTSTPTAATQATAAGPGTTPHTMVSVANVVPVTSVPVKVPSSVQAGSITMKASLPSPPPVSTVQAGRGSALGQIGSGQGSADAVINKPGEASTQDLQTNSAVAPVPPASAAVPPAAPAGAPATKTTLAKPMVATCVSLKALLPPLATRVQPLFKNKASDAGISASTPAGAAQAPPTSSGLQSLPAANSTPSNTLRQTNPLSAEQTMHATPVAQTDTPLLNAKSAAVPAASATATKQTRPSEPLPLVASAVPAAANATVVADQATPGLLLIAARAAVASAAGDSSGKDRADLEDVLPACKVGGPLHTTAATTLLASSATPQPDIIPKTPVVPVGSTISGKSAKHRRQAMLAFNATLPVVDSATPPSRSLSQQPVEKKRTPLTSTGSHLSPAVSGSIQNISSAKTSSQERPTTLTRPTAAASSQPLILSSALPTGFEEATSPRSAPPEPEQRKGKGSTTPVTAKAPRAAKRQKSTAQSSPDQADPVSTALPGTTQQAVAVAACPDVRTGPSVARGDMDIDRTAAIAAASPASAVSPTIVPATIKVTAAANKPAITQPTSQLLPGRVELTSTSKAGPSQSAKEDKQVPEKSEVKPDFQVLNVGPVSAPSAAQAHVASPAAQLKDLEKELMAFYGQIQLFATRRMPVADLIRYITMLLDEMTTLQLSASYQAVMPDRFQLQVGRIYLALEKVCVSQATAQSAIEKVATDMGNLLFQFLVKPLDGSDH